MTLDAGKHLSIRVDDTPRAVVVHVAGAVDMAAADELRGRLEQIAGLQRPLVALDLSGLEFIGSMGLGAIVYAHLLSRNHDGKIALVRPTPPVRKVLETARLNKVFPIYDSVDQAVAAET